MYRILMLSALSALALTACKPTPRTALAKQRPPQTQQGGGEQAPATPDASATVATTPEVPPTPIAAEQAEGAQSILAISATLQDYNRLRPWEKEDDSSRACVGVYLGEGKVLTIGNIAQAATYVEISLPDGSRSIPARVLRHDHDLNLALLAPVHEEDATLFETRRPLEPGEALKLGDTASLDMLVRGVIPVRIPLQAESHEIAEVSPLLQMPRLTMRAKQALPESVQHGVPVLRDGKLVGLATGGHRSSQSIYCINAELIARFLAEGDGEHASCPMIGIDFTELDDPVFRAYLKLEEAQGGIYVNKIFPGSAAEQAGLKEGDVVTAIEGMPIDTQGRVHHPLYGVMEVRAVLRSLKPMGETLALAISRDGEKQELSIPLDRAALEQDVLGRVDLPGTQPRYVIWGGLLFQPMTEDFVEALIKRSKGVLPVQYMEAESREKEWREKGVTELIALTQVIPTPATLSYENVGHCLVETVNGKTVHNFAEFVQLLDEPTPDGLVALGLNKAPYTIYVDRRMAETANSLIRRNAIQQLRNLGKGVEAQEATAEAAPAAVENETPAADAPAEPAPTDAPQG